MVFPKAKEAAAKEQPLVAVGQFLKTAVGKQVQVTLSAEREYVVDGKVVTSKSTTPWKGVLRSVDASMNVLLDSPELGSVVIRGRESMLHVMVDGHHAGHAE